MEEKERCCPSECEFDSPALACSCGFAHEPSEGLLCPSAGCGPPFVVAGRPIGDVLSSLPELVVLRGARALAVVVANEPKAKALPGPPNVADILNSRAVKQKQRSNFHDPRLKIQLAHLAPFSHRRRVA